jgi:hypothetical protein
VLLLIAGSVAISLLACAGIGLFVYQRYVAGPKTPNEAVNVYFRGLRQQDPDVLRPALCRESRPNADALVSDFAEMLRRDGFQLLDLRWTVARTEPAGDGAQRLVANATVEVDRQGSVYVRRIPVVFTLREQQGWRVCDADWKT